MAPGATPESIKLLDVAAEAARMAGSLLIRGAGSARTSVGTKSSATDMVTEMDRSSEALVVSTIRRRRPDDAIIAEEGSARTGSTGVRWVVDPLDGTTNYLYGFPVFAVSVAAELDGRAVAAAVHDPTRDETYTAIEGEGAWCNGTRLRPTALSDLGEALVGTGFSYDPMMRRKQAALLPEVLPRVRDIRRAGAAALDLCWVGSGRLDAFFESGLQPWDRAGGLLVAAEAGALTFDIPVEPEPRVLTVAAAPGVAAELRSLLERVAGRRPGAGP
jgi:myo-inositol-1(or 4)-monophosphatase